MTLQRDTASTLEEATVNVRIKLSGLWASVMFCYVYGDFIGLYKPGKLQMMLGGRMPLGPVSQGVLVGMATVMIVPSLMVFLSLVLPPQVNRWTNIVLGTVYTAIMLLTMPGAWHFYIFFGVIEVVLTALIIWYAWTWPRSAERARTSF